MKVKEILKNCAILLDDIKLAKSIENGECTAQENEVREMLLECCHIANTRIASEFVFLKDEVEIATSNGEIAFDNLSAKNILDIIAVTKDGYPIKFNVRKAKIYTQSGKVNVQYSYLPEKHDIDDDIDYYPGRISERVIAYATVSEYLAIKGNIDESIMWNDKFKSSISKVYAKHREIILPKRAWR